MPIMEESSTDGGLATNNHDERTEGEEESSSPARRLHPSSGEQESSSASSPDSLLPSMLSYMLLPHAPPLYYSKHVEYIVQLGSALDQSGSLEGAVTTHLRMSGV